MVLVATQWVQLVQTLLRDQNTVPVQTSIRFTCHIQDGFALAIQTPAGDEQSQ